MLAVLPSGAEEPAIPGKLRFKIGVWRCQIVPPEAKKVILKSSRPVTGQSVFDPCPHGPSPLGEAGAANRIPRTDRLWEFGFGVGVAICNDVVGRNIDAVVIPRKAPPLA
jgi:hypothetical protein